MHKGKFNLKIMKLTITSLTLKGPFQFFTFAGYAMRSIQQMRGAGVVEFRKTGFGLTHYTMSLWNTEADLHTFARSGAHAEAMRNSKKLAKEIRTLTIDADTMPDWKTAKQLLQQQGKVLNF